MIHLSTFENNVKIYGIKTRVLARCTCHMFENDVKIYGIKTVVAKMSTYTTFENDVKIYGIKTPQSAQPPLLRLRMM